MKRKIFLILVTLTAFFGALLGVACSKNKGSSAAQSSGDSGNSESSVPAHTCVWGREIFYDESGDGTHFQKCAVEGCEEKIIHTMGAWQFSGTEHWRVCSIANCEIDDRGEHLEKDGACEACAQDVCVVDFMLEPNAGEETKPFKTSVVLCGETIVYPSEEPTKTGYTFKGWMDKDGNTYLKAPTDTAYWRVEAKWKANTYAITYELNGGKNDKQNKGSYTYGAGMNLGTPTRGGYDFIEWQVNGEKIESIPSGSMGELTLTAVWSEPIFTTALGYEYVDKWGGATLSFNCAITGFTDYGVSKSYKTLVIPAEIDGVTIDAIGANAFKAKSIFSYVTFANTIRLIDDYAFYTNRVKGSIEFYGGIIGDCAFAETFVEELTYSCSIQGVRAFSNCDRLTKVTVTGDGNIGVSQFLDCGSLKEVYANNVVSLGASTFYRCVSLETFTSPVQTIGDWAFYGCEALSLTSFDFSSVREIGKYAFQNCTKLGNVIDRWAFASLETIGTGAFNNCGITYVYLPASVKEIGNRCFYGNEIEEFHFEDTENLEKIGQTAFHAQRVYIPDLIEWCGVEFDYDSTGLSITDSVLYNADLYVESTLVEDLDIVYDLHSGPVNNWRNLKRINAYAFAGCASLKYITIPSNVEQIDEYAFWRCDNAEKITIGSGVEWIKENAFLSCKAVGSIDFSEATSLTTIGAYAFAYNDNLKMLSVDGASLVIEQYAFYGSIALETLVIGDSVSSIGYYAFQYCPNIYRITLGAGLQSVAYYAFEAGYINHVAEVYNRSSLYATSNGSLGMGTGYSSEYIYIAARRFWTDADDRGSIEKTADGFVYYTYIDYFGETKTELIHYTGEETDVVVLSDKEIDCIAEYAFWDNDEITSFTVNQVRLVEWNVFYSCDNLKSITINGNYSESAHVLYMAIRDCVNLDTVTIGDGFEWIGVQFGGCTSLKRVVIGKTVKEIDKYAFYGDSYGLVLENLTAVYYMGSADDWSKIYTKTWNNETASVETVSYELPEGIALYCYSAEEPQKNEDGTAYDGNYWRYVNGEIVVWEFATEA